MKMHFIGFFELLCAVAVTLVTLAEFNRKLTVVAQDRYFWYEHAKSQLNRRLDMELNHGRAKNIIFFVGDGMGLSTITAARILRGQLAGHTGEETELTFEKFPYVALAKTYNVDSQVGDSAACATALMCGVKGRLETLGLDDKGEFEKCSSSFESRVSCLMDWAHQEGKATGLVTNTRVTHATPAALYAHVASRYWEDENKIPEDGRQACKDIARQLVEDEPGRNINVILGGGRRHFLPSTLRDPRHPNELGRRRDGRHIIDDWIQDKKKRDLSHKYVWTADQLRNIDPDKVDYLLGLFSASHMDFESDRDKSGIGQPSLAEMTKKAIEILRKNPHGYFLMVEGGRIDHAHHYSNAYRALYETLSLEDSVAAALMATSPEETLVVVTADHSHVFALGGSATKRGNPIFGGRLDHAHHFNNAYRALGEVLSLENAVIQTQAMVNLANTLIVVTADHSHVLTVGGYARRGQDILGFDTKLSDVDNLPYTTLLYANGPGYDHNHPAGRPNLTGVDTSDKDYVQQSAVPRRWETHSGEDVPVYANGPMAHLFQGVVEQTFVAHAMAFAACIGNYKHLCYKSRRHQPQQPLCDAIASSAVSSVSINRMRTVVVRLWNHLASGLLFTVLIAEAWWR